MINCGAKYETWACYLYKKSLHIEIADTGKIIYYLHFNRDNLSQFLREIALSMIF